LLCSGRTAMECMGLCGVSRLLHGFNAASHYDPVLWAAAVGDASTWMGAQVSVWGVWGQKSSKTYYKPGGGSCLFWREY